MRARSRLVNGEGRVSQFRLCTQVQATRLIFVCLSARMMRHPLDSHTESGHPPLHRHLLLMLGVSVRLTAVLFGAGTTRRCVRTAATRAWSSSSSPHPPTTLYAIPKKSGDFFRVGIFLGFVRRPGTTRRRAPRGAHVRGAERNRIDRRSRTNLPLSFRHTPAATSRCV